MVRRTVVCLACLCVATSTLLVASAAGAEETKKDQGYEYWFQDDPLKAAGADGNLPLIKVRATGTRQSLMRPRTAFVPELLKSVENM